MRRILVVDDDREVVRLIRAYLEQAGFDVFAAYDGETAIHSLRRDQPDLLLLDLMLP
ncbi:MAG TPA: response regulator, partial [Promineifilum sp.]|nr:response regulator [Promineifilum sp.]